MKSSLSVRYHILVLLLGIPFALPLYFIINSFMHSVFCVCYVLVMGYPWHFYVQPPFWGLTPQGGTLACQECQECHAGMSGMSCHCDSLWTKYQSVTCAHVWCFLIGWGLNNRRTMCNSHAVQWWWVIPAIDALGVGAQLSFYSLNFNMMAHYWVLVYMHLSP